jgi:hypothetical protein
MADEERLGYVGRQGEALRMNRRYLQVVIAIVVVFTLAYVFVVFVGTKPGSTPATTVPAAGTKTPS